MAGALRAEYRSGCPWPPALTNGIPDERGPCQEISRNFVGQTERKLLEIVVLKTRDIDEPGSRLAKATRRAWP